MGSIDEAAVVLTEQGTVQGRPDGETAASLGLPYAAAPVRELRFAPPAPHPAWDGPLDTSSVGLAAPQPVLASRVAAGCDAVPHKLHPCLSVAAGAGKSIDVMIGTTAEEMSPFLMLEPKLRVAPREPIFQMLGTLFPGIDAQVVYERYAARRPGVTPGHVLADAISGRLVCLPALQVAEVQAEDAHPAQCLRGRAGAAFVRNGDPHCNRLSRRDAYERSRRTTMPFDRLMCPSRTLRGHSGRWHSHW